MGNEKEVPPPSYLDAVGTDQSTSDRTPLLQPASSSTSYNAIPPPTSPPAPSSYVSGAVPVQVVNPEQARASTYYIYNGQTPIFLESSRQPVGYDVSETGLVLLTARESVLMFCPYEGVHVVTAVQTRPSCVAYLTSLMLCFIGCGICFFLPFCSPKCQTQVHRCPSCDRVLAIVPP